MSSGYCGLGIMVDRIKRCQMIKRVIVSLIAGVSMLFASGAANADTITCYQQGGVQVCYRTPTVIVVPGVVYPGYYGYGHRYYNGYRGYYGHGYGVRGYGGRSFHGGGFHGGFHGRR